MEEGEHPLLTKRIGGAFTLLALALGVGLVLMSAHQIALLWLGVSISLLGVIGAVWIYGGDLLQLRLRVVRNDGTASKLTHELRIIAGAVVFSILSIIGLLYHELHTPGNGRHLNPFQRAAIIKALSSIKVAHVIYVNSASSCDECEIFAQELRDAVNAAPGWMAGGSTDILGTAAIKGIKIFTQSKQNIPEFAKAVAAALNAAQIQFDWSDGSLAVYEGGIYVAREP